MQNSGVAMTKEAYFEMCETLGEEPIEENIPVEIEDFPYEVQEAFSIYSLLQDNWDGFSGSYQGKSFAGISELLDIFEVETEYRKFFIQLLYKIDSIRVKETNAKLTQKKPAA